MEALSWDSISTRNLWGESSCFTVPLLSLGLKPELTESLRPGAKREQPKCTAGFVGSSASQELRQLPSLGHPWVSRQHLSL